MFIKSRISIILPLIFILCFVTADVYAATQNAPISAPTLRESVINGEFYSDFNVTLETYVFDESSGVAFTSGQVPIAAATPQILFYEHKTLVFSVVIDGVTSIDIIILGRSEDAGATSGTWGSIYTKSFTTSTTYGFVVPVAEHVDYLRIGVKRTGGSPTANDVITVKYTMRNLQ